MAGSKKINIFEWPSARRPQKAKELGEGMKMGELKKRGPLMSHSDCATQRSCLLLLLTLRLRLDFKAVYACHQNLANSIRITTHSLKELAHFIHKKKELLFGMHDIGHLKEVLYYKAMASSRSQAALYNLPKTYFEKGEVFLWEWNFNHSLIFAFKCRLAFSKCGLSPRNKILHSWDILDPRLFIRQTQMLAVFSFFLLLSPALARALALTC